MNAFVDFVVRLLGDVILMPILLGRVVRDGDPMLLSAIIVAVGTVFITAAVAVFGYALLGALGIPLPKLGSGPGKQIE